MLVLRPYQEKCIDYIRLALRSGYKAPLLVAPTGSGKTVMFVYIADGAARKQNMTLILVHRQELIEQTTRSLQEMGVAHGIVAAGYTPNPFAPVQLASVQTIVRRIDSHPWRPRMIIIDEAHHATAGSWRKVIEAFPEARILGVTATPERLDGKGLGADYGGVFDTMVQGPQVQNLMDGGFLAKALYFAPPSGLDLDNLPTRGGDYAKDAAEIIVDKPKITGDAVEHYARLCPGAPAVSFCVSLKHAEHVAEQFRAAGFRWATIDGGLSNSDRKERVRDLQSGRLHGLSSCDLINEGFDLPKITAAILLRPTQSLGLHLQQLGRALRPAEGKTHAIILDHVGNCIKHGLAEDPREWSLEGARKRNKKKTADDEPKFYTKQCPKCYACHTPAPVCPSCGYVYDAGRELEEVEGTLVLIGAGMEGEPLTPQEIEHDRAVLLKIAAERGYEEGWVDYVMEARIKNRTRAPIDPNGTITEWKGEINDRWKQCPGCGKIHRREDSSCPKCGHIYDEARAKKKENGRAQTLEELRVIGRKRGYKNPNAWAFNVFRSRRQKHAVRDEATEEQLFQ